MMLLLPKIAKVRYSLYLFFEPQKRMPLLSLTQVICTAYYVSFEFTTIKPLFFHFYFYIIERKRDHFTVTPNNNR